jgi:hypothetical protein
MADPIVPPAAGAPAVTPAPETPPDDDRIVLTKEALGQRLDRAKRSALKAEFGTEDTAEIKSKLEALAKYEAEREEARKAAMSREQQLAEEVAREKAAREKAEQEAATARFEAHTSRMYAELGIKNHDYATFKLANAISAHTGEGKFDDRKFLDELLADRRERVALGLDEAPATAVPVTPKDTTPGVGQAPPPPSAGAPRANKTAFDMSPQEWAAFQAKNGIA